MGFDNTINKSIKKPSFYTHRYYFIIFAKKNELLMSKAERTKRYIIKKSAEHFNKKGYTGTSLRDITELTGLTKGSIYGNFENKEEVAQAVYRYNAKNIGNQLLNASRITEGGAKEKLIGILDYYRDNWEDFRKAGGCPLLNAATEVDDTLPKLVVDVRRSFMGFFKMFESIILEGMAEKVFKEDLNVKHLASTMVILIEGGILLAKTMDNRDYLNVAFKRIETIIENEIML